MQFRNPRINRMIGYIILFVGFGFIFWGYHYPTAEEPVNGHNYFIAAIGYILIVGSFIWMIKKVRCPHCGNLLHLKLYPISRCPYCGKPTDEMDKK